MTGDDVGQERGRSQDEDEQSGSGTSNGKREWSTAERTTLVISLLIIVGLIMVAVVEMFNRPEEATAVIDVQIETGQAEPRDDLFAVPFSVTNVGGAGANAITIRFEVVSADDEPVDSVTITLDVLPVRGVEEGELLISHDPATHTITGRAETYMLP